MGTPPHPIADGQDILVEGRGEPLASRTPDRPVTRPATVSAVVAVVTTPTPASTPKPTAVPDVQVARGATSPVYALSTGDIQAEITHWANHYGVAPSWLTRIIDSESSFSPTAVNPRYTAPDGNHPSGIFQYIASTWASFSAQANLPGANIWDYRAQVQVTA